LLGQIERRRHPLPQRFPSNPGSLAAGGTLTSTVIEALRRQFVIDRIIPVNRDEAAFKAHQESAHFRTYIAGEALPLLAKRERSQYALL
jgi:quinol monooxygenase YgiN